MTAGEFDAVFDRFQTSAFRLETLPRYANDEGEEFAAFLAVDRFRNAPRGPFRG
jgi:hypothetical protein